MDISCGIFPSTANRIPKFSKNGNVLFHGHPGVSRQTKNDDDDDDRRDDRRDDEEDADRPRLGSGGLGSPGSPPFSCVPPNSGAPALPALHELLALPPHAGTGEEVVMKTEAKLGGWLDRGDRHRHVGET